MADLEHDLWLLAFGASLASADFCGRFTSVFSSEEVPVGLNRMFTAISRANPSEVRRELTTAYRLTFADSNQRCIEAILSDLQQRAYRKQAEQVVKQMPVLVAGSKISPEAIVEVLEATVKRLKELKPT